MRFFRPSIKILALVSGFLWAAAAPAGEIYRWTQYGPDGLEARAITDAGTCPLALIDGEAQIMIERSTPADGYPVRSCQIPIPASVKSVTLDNVPVALAKTRPDRILLVGDSGCRLRGSQVQACHDIQLWPFRLIATMGAHFKPDLVIHVGDMHYRESPCPPGNMGCAGSPYGDNWAVWREDFFAPAEALLGAAPWVMLRGNHEECHRGGIGWARMLDPYPFDIKAGKAGCLGPQMPFTVDLGGVTLLVMDVSTADERLNEIQAAFYRPQFEKASALKGPVWYGIHRPIWAAENRRRGTPEGDNRTLAAAAKGVMPPNAQLMLSGHHHVYSVMKYEGDLPLQIVAGHSGNALSVDAPTPLTGMEINGEKIVAGLTRPGLFGFAMLEREASDLSGLNWTITGYDERGRAAGSCKISGRNLECD